MRVIPHRAASTGFVNTIRTGTFGEFAHNKRTEEQRRKGEPGTPSTASWNTSDNVGNAIVALLANGDARSRTRTLCAALPRPPMPPS